MASGMKTVNQSSAVRGKRMRSSSPSFALKDLKDKYENLNREMTKRPIDLIKCRAIFNEVKVLMIINQSYVDPQGTPQIIFYARSILEFGVQLDILEQNKCLFRRDMAQLKMYYLDAGDNIQDSPVMWEMMGLNLLYLLSENRLAEFHTEIERIPPQFLTNTYIKPVVEYEQYLMEGNYNKIKLVSHNVPSKLYSFFVQHLLSTVRASLCDESISVQNADRLEFSQNELYGVGGRLIEHFDRQAEDKTGLEINLKPS